MKKYFIDCMFADESFAEISKDGLLYRFQDNPEVVNKLELNKLDYDNINSSWFFNTSHDRHCAERNNGYILVNPSIIASTLGLPILFE
jgi:hypothetical protein